MACTVDVWYQDHQIFDASVEQGADSVEVSDAGA